MNKWINRLLKRASKVPRPNVSHGGWWPRRTLTGIAVTEEVSLTATAVWAAVRIISETIGTLSWHTFERQAGGGRRMLPDHPVDWLVHQQPNPEMTACSFRETLQSHALLWGNGYAEIERDRAGRPLWMWPLPPDRVTPKRDDNGAIVYEVRGGSGNNVVIPARDMFHVSGLGFDGLVGYSPIRMHANAVGMGLAQERFGAAFYGNDSTPSGVLQHPAELEEEARANMRDDWESLHRGTGNSHRVAILEEGVTWQSIQIPQNDAQYIESRKFQVIEVARIYRLPPHKLGDLDGSIKANIEAQGIEFVSDSILPWACKWEQEANRKLFGRNNQGNIFTKLNLDTLLRADIKSRYDAYAVGRNWGWLSADDVRQLEDLNPLPSDQNGDTYLIPANMVPAERALDEPEPPPAPFQDGDQPEEPVDEPVEETDDRSVRSIQYTFNPLLVDIMRRCVTREGHRMTEATSPDAISAFYVEHVDYMRRSLKPAMSALADLITTQPASATSKIVDSVVNEWTLERCTEANREVDHARSTDSLAELKDLWVLVKPTSMATSLSDRIRDDLTEEHSGAEE